MSCINSPKLILHSQDSSPARRDFLKTIAAGRVGCNPPYGKFPARRDFFKAVAALAGGTAIEAGTTAEGASCFEDTTMPNGRARSKLPVAGVVTVYREMSHADVLLGKILEGWQQDGGPGPDLTLASIYVDQVGDDDMSHSLAKRFGFRIAKSIDEAITLGTDKVQVSGVLSIGEHGNYPLTPDTKQQMYPRRQFFEQIVAAFDRCGSVVPVFNDKHLAYRWEDARWMYDAAKKRDVPFLAGSSVPVGWRFPAIELDRSDELESALTVGWAGLEIYGFHALEAHQAMVERRKGGESGIVTVQALQGDAIHQAAREGRWSRELFKQALATIPGTPEIPEDWTTKPDTAVFLLEHRDGLKSAVVMVGSLTTQFAFAAKVKSKPDPVACWIRLQDGKPFCHFAYLLRAIEETIHTCQPVYPVERTLLTTGILDRIMHSLAENSKAFDTQELDIAYQPTDWPFANHAKNMLQLDIFAGTK